MKTLVFLYFLLPLRLTGQDVTGLWTGFLNTSGNRLPYELVISETGNKLTGYSLTVFTMDGIENIGIKSMKVKTKRGDISIEDDELIYNNYTTPAKRVTLYAELSLKTEDSIMTLDGTFFTRSLDRSSFKGTIHLLKRNNFSETKLITQLDKMNLSGSISFRQPKIINKETTSAEVTKKEPDPIESSHTIKNSDLPPIRVTAKKKPVALTQRIPVINSKPAPVQRNIAAEIALRKTEIIRNILFKSDSLVLSLYDNGEIDGDTVSVVLNNKMVIAKKGLGAKLSSTTVYLTPDLGDSLRLIMYAENLGSIPPNTGVLVIQDGDDRHDIRFAGDFQRNSAILLIRKR